MELTAPVVAKGTVIIGGGSLGAYGVTELVRGGSGDESNLVEPSAVVDNDLALKFLFNTTNFGTSGDYVNSGGTFGYSFGRFMLDTDDNEDKWTELENQAKEAQDSELDDKFKPVKKNSGSDYKKIQNICKEIYKDKRENLLKAEKNSLLSNIWKYCTPFKEKPKTLDEVSEKTYSESSWVEKYKDYKKSLLSTTDTNNKVWKHLLENVLKWDIREPKEIKSKFKDITTLDGLKNECNSAYEASSTDSNENDYGTSVLDYCSLDRAMNKVSSSSFTYPKGS